MEGRSLEASALVDVTVQAAGGVVTRAADDGIEILVVHRPRYDDWSLPKGKLEPGESHEHAALREVEEETGVQCALGGELPPLRYVDRKGRDKVVRYWHMTSLAQGEWHANDEVDDVRWVPFSDAATLLTYHADRELVAGVVREGRGEQL